MMIKKAGLKNNIDRITYPVYVKIISEVAWLLNLRMGQLKVHYPNHNRQLHPVT